MRVGDKTMDLIHILCHTDMIQFLTRRENYALRQLNRDADRHLRARLPPIRRCQRPVQPSWHTITIGTDEEACSLLWEEKLPSVIPRAVWPRILYMFHEYLTLDIIRRWMRMDGRPIVCEDQRRWRIGLEVECALDEDDWIAIGVSWGGGGKDTILGFDPRSIGYVSDDNCVYHDSLRLVKNHCRYLPALRHMACVIDYEDGTLSFFRNHALEFVWEMDGRVLLQSLVLGISTNIVPRDFPQKLILTHI